MAKKINFEKEESNLREMLAIQKENTLSLETDLIATKKELELSEEEGSDVTDEQKTVISKRVEAITAKVEESLSFEKEIDSELNDLLTSKEKKKVIKKEEEKKTVREVIDLEAEVIVGDVAKIQAKLKELAMFANTNHRPHKHFTIFSNDMELFVRRFKRMLR